MNKQNFIKALSGVNSPGEVPFWELEFHLWNKLSDRPFYVGEAFLALTAAEKEKAIHTNAEIAGEVGDRLGFSALTAPGGYWEVAPGVPAYYWLPEGYREKQVEALIQTLGGRFAVTVNIGGILAMPAAENYVEFSCLLYEDPEAVDRLAESILRGSMDMLHRYRDMGVEFFLTASDIADNSGPYFSPPLFERFILPCLHRWAEQIKASGAWSILHTDGNIERYLRQIADTPLHTLQALDPVAGMDLLKAKEIVGRDLCLCGNMDCGLLITSDPDTIFNQSLSLLRKAGKIPGYSFGTSNALEFSTPRENFMAMAAAYRQYIEEQKE